MNSPIKSLSRSVSSRGSSMLGALNEGSNLRASRENTSEILASGQRARQREIFPTLSANSLLKSADNPVRRTLCAVELPSLLQRDVQCRVVEHCCENQNCRICGTYQVL